MPAKRKIGKLGDCGIKRENLGEADQGSIRFLSITASQELPRAIVAVMCDVQNWIPTEDDRFEREHRDISWLIEREGTIGFVLPHRQIISSGNNRVIQMTWQIRFVLY